MHNFLLRLSDRFFGPSKEDLLCELHYNMPKARHRKSMSVVELADFLEQPQHKVAQIVMAHELDLRLARVQSTAAWKVGVLSFIGGIVVALLGAWLPKWLEKDANQPARPNASQEAPDGNLKIERPAVVQPSASEKIVAPASHPNPSVKQTQASPPDGKASQ